MDKGKSGGEDTRALLIRAGMEELNEYGVAHFSSRRIAKKCGVSSATPYKHFKDVDAFIAAILKHIFTLYAARQEKVLETCDGGDSRRQLLEVAMDYICFLTEYPELRRALMQSSRYSSPEYQNLLGNISIQILRAAARYSRDMNMSPETRKRKTFMIRSIIYGAAASIDQGSLPRGEESMEMVRGLLERELDLP